MQPKRQTPPLIRAVPTDILIRNLREIQTELRNRKIKA
jgi:hypothetical protein